MFSALQAFKFRIRSAVFETKENLDPEFAQAPQSLAHYKYSLGVGFQISGVQGDMFVWQVELGIKLTPRSGAFKKQAKYTKIAVTATQAYTVPVTLAPLINEDVIMNSIGMLYTSMKSYISLSTSPFWCERLDIPSLDVKAFAETLSTLPEILEAVRAAVDHKVKTASPPATEPGHA